MFRVAAAALAGCFSTPMLILSRKTNESIVIGDGIVIRVLRISRDSVKLGIEAPAECRVHREELLLRTPKGPSAGAVAPPGDAAEDAS